MAAYAVAHLDELDELIDGRCFFRPVRHHFGITAFGATAWTARAAGDLIVDEHDEGDPTADQELFLVLRGHAVFELEGDRVDAPAGTFVFAPPRTKRRAFAEESGTTIMLIEGTPGKAYERPRLGTLGSARPSLRGGRVRRGRRPSTRPGRSLSSVRPVVLQPRLLRESLRPDD